MARNINHKVAGNTLRFAKGMIALLLSSGAFILLLYLITILIKLV